MKGCRFAVQIYSLEVAPTDRVLTFDLTYVLDLQSQASCGHEKLTIHSYSLIDANSWLRPCLAHNFSATIWPLIEILRSVVHLLPPRSDVLRSRLNADVIVTTAGDHTHTVLDKVTHCSTMWQ